MIKFLKDLLFGKKISFVDSKIGELTTRIKDGNPSINYTWLGEHMLTGQKKPTVFILEGNANGPYKHQLSSAHRIIDTLDNIVKWVDTQLKQKENLKPIFKNDWKNNFYLAAITSYDYDPRSSINKFEVTFEPLLENQNYYTGLIWENDKFSEFVAK